MTKEEDLQLTELAYTFREGGWCALAGLGIFVEKLLEKEREKCIKAVEDVGPKDYPEKLITDGFVLAIRGVK
jgi:hypothetical protein